MEDRWVALVRQPKRSASLAVCSVHSFSLTMFNDSFERKSTPWFAFVLNPSKHIERKSFQLVQHYASQTTVHDATLFRSFACDAVLLMCVFRFYRKILESDPWYFVQCFRFNFFVLKHCLVNVSSMTRQQS